MFKVEVLSRDQVEQYEPTGKEICISIRSFNPNYPYPQDSDRVAILSDKFQEVLSLQFDDIDPTTFPIINAEMASIWSPMSNEQAKEVVKFVEKWVDNADKLIVHCYGGISRSRSMASAICDEYNIEEPFIVYNKWVYNKVSDAFAI